jgi:hypothetical protein
MYSVGVMAGKFICGITVSVHDEMLSFVSGVD